MNKPTAFALAILVSIFCSGQSTESDGVSKEQQQQIEQLKRTLAEAQRQLNEASEQLDQNYGRTLERIMDHASVLIAEAAAGFDHAPHHPNSEWYDYTQYQDDPDRAFLGLQLDVEEEGLKVVAFTIDSESTPIQEGDLLISINDVDLANAENGFVQLKDELQNVQVGETVAIVVDRDGQLIELAVPTWSQHEFYWQPHRWNQGDFEALPGVGEIRRLTTHRSLHLIDIEQPLAKYFDVEEGVLLVNPPQNQDELKAGDVILSVGDIESNSAAEVNGILGFLENPVELTILRKGKQREVTIDPKRIQRGFNRGENAMFVGLNSSENRLQLADIDGGLGEYFNVDGGILVISTRDDSELQVGDVILQIGSINVGTANQTNGILRQLDQPVQLTVRRENRTLEVMVDPLQRTHMQSFRAWLPDNLRNWNR